MASMLVFIVSNLLGNERIAVFQAVKNAIMGATAAANEELIAIANPVIAASMSAPSAVIAASISTPRAAIAAFISVMDAKNVTSPTMSVKIASALSFIVTIAEYMSDKIDCKMVNPNNENIGYTGV